MAPTPHPQPLTRLGAVQFFSTDGRRPTWYDILPFYLTTLRPSIHRSIPVMANSQQKHRTASLFRLLTFQNFRKPSPKRLDPFSVLPTDIIPLIIEHLSPVDTEIIRRVSKTWKKASERWVTAAWIARYFPESRDSVSLLLSEASAENQNLHFRRLLYCEQNIRLGRASAYLHLEGVGNSCVLGDNILVTCNGTAFKIFDLALYWRTKQLESIEIDILLPHRDTIVFLICGMVLEDDIALVCEEKPQGHAGGSFAPVTFISRYSKNGVLKWKTALGIERGWPTYAAKKVLYWIDPSKVDLFRIDLTTGVILEPIRLGEHIISFVPVWMLRTEPIYDCNLVFLTVKRRPSQTIHVLILNPDNLQLVWIPRSDLRRYIPSAVQEHEYDHLENAARIVRELVTSISARAMVQMLSKIAVWQGRWEEVQVPFINPLVSNYHYSRSRIPFSRRYYLTFEQVRVGNGSNVRKWWVPRKTIAKYSLSRISKTHKALQLKHVNHEDGYATSVGIGFKALYEPEGAGYENSLHILQFMPEW